MIHFYYWISSNVYLPLFTGIVSPELFSGCCFIRCLRPACKQGYWGLYLWLLHVIQLISFLLVGFGSNLTLIFTNCFSNRLLLHFCMLIMGHLWRTQPMQKLLFWLATMELNMLLVKDQVKCCRGVHPSSSRYLRCQYYM